VVVFSFLFSCENERTFPWSFFPLFLVLAAIAWILFFFFGGKIDDGFSRPFFFFLSSFTEQEVALVSFPLFC